MSNRDLVTAIKTIWYPLKNSKRYYESEFDEEIDMKKYLYTNILLIIFELWLFYSLRLRFSLMSILHF